MVSKPKKSLFLWNDLVCCWRQNQDSISIVMKFITETLLIYQNPKLKLPTKRGGSVVTIETRIREVPGSNPGADQPEVFSWFSLIIKANA